MVEENSTSQWESVFSMIEVPTTIREILLRQSRYQPKYSLATKKMNDSNKHYSKSREKGYEHLKIIVEQREKLTQKVIGEPTIKILCELFNLVRNSFCPLSFYSLLSSILLLHR
jgi:hypothetical protein